MRIIILRCTFITTVSMNFILEDEATEETTEELCEAKQSPHQDASHYPHRDCLSGSLSTVPDEVSSSAKEILRRSPLIGKRKEKFIREVNQRNSPPRAGEPSFLEQQLSGEPAKTSQAWQQSSLLKLDSSSKDKLAEVRSSQLSLPANGLRQFWKKSLLDSDSIPNRAFTTLPSLSEQIDNAELFKICVYNSVDSNEEILDRLAPSISIAEKNPSSHESHFSKANRHA